jgi:hypothetical protein
LKNQAPQAFLDERASFFDHWPNGWAVEKKAAKAESVFYVAFKTVNIVHQKKIHAPFHQPPGIA